MNNIKKLIFRTQTEDIVPPSECKLADITISSIDAEASDDGTVWLDYTNCSGYIVNLQYPDAGTYTGLCVDPDTSFAFYYFLGGAATNAGSSGAIITATDCT